MVEVMDAGNGTGSSTRDSQSHPAVDDDDEQQQQQQQHDSPKTYPQLGIWTESGGNSFELGLGIASNGDGGSSKSSSLDHFDMDPEIIRRGISNKHSEPVHPEVTTKHKSSFNNGSFKIDSGVIARNSSSDHLESSQMESPATGSHVQSQLPVLSESHDHAVGGEGRNKSPTKFPIIKMGSSSSSSSSSSSQPAHENDNDNDEFYPRSHHDEDQLARDSGVSQQNTKPGEKESSSLNPDIDNKPMTLEISPTQLPPVQVMQRSEEYDPNRIPQSVFQRSSSDAQNDWSIASNESLFSIHVGTSNSFSREQALFISEARRSEENSKSNEVFSFTPPHPLRNPDDDDSPNSPTAFPVAELVKADAAAAAGPSGSHSVVESQNKHMKVEKEGEITPATKTENAKRPAEEQHGNQKKVPTVSWRSTSVSNFSDRSQNSTRSFAFPITKKTSSKMDGDGEDGEEESGIMSSRSKKDWDGSSFYCSNVSTWSWPSCYYRSCGTINSSGSSSGSWWSWLWCKCCCNCTGSSSSSSSWSSWCKCCCNWSSCFSCKSLLCRTKKRGWWPSSLSCCYCSNCSSICSFRYCVRPSCCCCTLSFCSSGSNYSWTGCCYCWNCSSKKRWCCHPSSTLSDEARLESAKKEQKREQKQETGQQKKAKRRWYNFLCCPWKKCCCCYCSCFSYLRCPKCWHC